MSFLSVVGQKVDIKAQEQLAQEVVSRLLNPDAPEQIYLLRKSLYADEIAKKMNTVAAPRIILIDEPIPGRYLDSIEYLLVIRNRGEVRLSRKLTGSEGMFVRELLYAFNCRRAKATWACELKSLTRSQP